MKNKKVHKRGSLFLAVVVVLVILGSGAWSVYWFGYKNMTAASQKADVPDGSAQRLPFDLTSLLDVDKVRQLATASTVARMRGLELNKASGKLSYTVSLSDGSVVKLDAISGERQSTRGLPSNLPDGEGGLPPNFTADVSFDQARQSAQDRFPEGSITKMMLTGSSGKVIIRVVFADNASVDIDAGSGDVVHFKRPD